MSGKITFVGAGPGAPDLITIRGAEALKQAGLVVYAGSLVNEKLLELAEHAELVNSAKLALEEVLELLVSGFRAEKGGAPAYRRPCDVRSCFRAVPRTGPSRHSL